MAQNIYNYFFEYDLSKTPGFIYVLANFLGVIIYTSFNPRKRKDVWSYAELIILELMYLIYNFLTRDISTVLFIPSIMGAFLFTTLMIYAVCDMNRRNVIYYAVRAYAFGELAGALGWQLVSYVFEKRRVPHSVSVQCLITVGTLAALFAFFLMTEKYINRDQKHLHVERKEVVISVVMCVCMIAASNLSYVSASTPFSSNVPGDIYIIRTIVDIAGVSLLSAYHIILKESHEKVEMAQMAALHRMQYANYQVSRTSIDLINQKYHDLKHQIEFLKMEISEKEKIAYLNKMEKEIQQYEAENKTGNHILDTILTTKSLNCQEKNIQMTCVADGKALDFLNPMDICSIFGNALDNAITSAEKVENPEKRLIHVTVSQEKSFLRIKIENSFQGELKIKNQLPVTTKADRRYHGFGVKSMKAVAEKYKGSLTVSAKDGWFELRILIPLPESEKII